MVSMFQGVMGLTCGLLLCLGLTDGVQARDEMNAGQPQRTGGQVRQPTLAEWLTGIHTIQGDVVRVEGGTYVVKGQDGKEAQLFVNHNTKKVGNIHPGDRIEAKVNLLNHALAIVSAHVTDVVSRK